MLELSMLGLLTAFAAGTVFVLLGASATGVDQLLLEYRYETNIAGGSIIIIFGLFMMGLLLLPWLQRELRLDVNIPGGRPLGAYVLGLAFAFGWTLCIGPILGAILTLGEASATVSDDTALLAVYSLGLGLPFVVAATFTGAFLARLRTMRRFGRWLQLFAGGVIVAMEVAMITRYHLRFCLLADRNVSRPGLHWMTRFHGRSACPELECDDV